MHSATGKDQHFAQIGSAPKNAGLVVVLGMHRSGTSALGHILAKAGYFVGEASDLMQGNQWNRDGYFERWSIVRLNDIILYLCGGSWDAPPAARDIARIRVDPKIEVLLKAYEGHDKSIIKDPRLCLTFPVWQRAWGPGVRIISITRQPEAVAASLMQRDGFTQQKSIALWHIYTARAARYAKNHPVYIIQYEDLFAEHRRQKLKELAAFLGIATDLENIAQQVIDPAQQHHKSDNPAARHDATLCSEAQNAYAAIQPLIQCGRFAEAVEELVKMLARWPDHALAHNDLGVLHFQTGRKEHAKKHLEKSVELDPGNSTARKNLAFISKTWTDASTEKQGSSGA